MNDAKMAAKDDGKNDNKDKNYTITYEKMWALYGRPKAPAPVGESNRVKVQHTITPETHAAWVDFQTTHTGQAPQRGRGLSSSLTEMGMRLLMCVVAGWKLDEIADELKTVVPKAHRRAIAETFGRLSALMEQPLIEFDEETV